MAKIRCSRHLRDYFLTPDGCPGTRTMTTLSLVPFNNICAACGSPFTSYHLPPEQYGLILFTTPRGDAAVLNPDEDAHWRKLSEQVTRLWPSLSAVQVADKMDKVLPLTVDPLPSGSLFVWGRIPCPRCGSTKRASYGPKSDGAPRTVTAVAVSHTQWMMLPEQGQLERLRRGGS